MVELAQLDDEGYEFVVELAETGASVVAGADESTNIEIFSSLAVQKLINYFWYQVSHYVYMLIVFPHIILYLTYFYWSMFAIKWKLSVDETWLNEFLREICEAVITIFGLFSIILEITILI